jgi:hypothetical protein
MANRVGVERNLRRYCPFSGLLGINLEANRGGTVFHGTVAVEGESGGNIAPLLIQMNWPSIRSIPANLE